MTDHMWVSMQYTPIHVDEMPDGSISVSADLSAIQVSEEEALMGCWFCHAPLSPETYHTSCGLRGNIDGNLDSPPSPL